MNKNDEFIDKLEIMLKANMVPWVITHEEEKFIVSLRKLMPKIRAPKLRVLVWSLSEGAMDYTAFLTKNASGKYSSKSKMVPTQEIPDPIVPTKTIVQNVLLNTYEQALDFASNEQEPLVLIIKDIQHVLKLESPRYPERERLTRDLIQQIRSESTSVIFLTPSGSIPPDLQKEIHSIEMPLPDKDEISSILDVAMDGFSQKDNAKIDINYINSKGKPEVTRYEGRHQLREKIILNLLGLSEVEISLVLTYTFVKNHGITASSLSDIKDMKREIIEREGSLQFIATPDKIEIGGHDQFKEYVDERSLYLDKKFREHFNLPPPKGVCLVGPPGSGKSMFARYIGYRWQLPLIRLDMGAIYGRLLGESENRLRDALKVIEANAPCILWIDEIEKALGGVNNSESGGTTLRIFGKILTWMAEREEMIFMYCTANDLSAIPPEFQRAGRLDSIWWGDLPSEADCVQIVQIHCKANKIELAPLDYQSLGYLAHEAQMTGAEIEHAISESSFKAAKVSYDDHLEIDVSLDIISKVMKTIRTYAKSHEEHLRENRLYAYQKFEFTSTESKAMVSKLAGDDAAIRREFDDPK